MEEPSMPALTADTKQLMEAFVEPTTTAPPRHAGHARANGRDHERTPVTVAVTDIEQQSIYP